MATELYYNGLWMKQTEAAKLLNVTAGSVSERLNWMHKHGVTVCLLQDYYKLGRQKRSDLPKASLLPVDLADETTRLVRALFEKQLSNSGLYKPAGRPKLEGVDKVRAMAARLIKAGKL